MALLPNLMTSNLCLKLFVFFGPLVCTVLGEFNLKPIVTTTHGMLQGIASKSRNGRIYYSYKGIPYAKPPLGELRLEPPQPMLPWNGIMSVNKDPPPCSQIDNFVTGQIQGEEDCLYLNVFTTRKPRSSEPLLPVIFNIYGGSFVSGDAALYGPQYFMDFDVVVVTFNYRLGLFGFFSTGDGVLEGNQGLKDQNMALKWFKDNAAQFGGDPNRITLAGESSGGVAVYYHILSPMSQGLFHRAILNSGTPFGIGGFQNKPKEQARFLGTKAGCPVDDSRLLIACLKGKEADELVSLTDSQLSPFHGDVDTYAATVEVTRSDTTFFHANPNAILASGNFAKIPIIIGVNSGEGGILTAQLKGSDNMKYLDSQWDVYAPLLAAYDSKRIDASRALKSYFLPNNELPSNNLYNLTRFFSMTAFWEDCNYLAKVHSQFAPVRLFYYNYISVKILNIYFLVRNVRANSPIWPLRLTEAVIENYVTEVLFPGMDPNQFGAAHASDLPITWKMFPLVFEVPKWSKDYPFSNAFVKTMVDFAYGSEPLHFNGTFWDQVDPRETLCYMEMRNSGSRMINEPFEDEVAFFQGLGLRDRSFK